MLVTRALETLMKGKKLVNNNGASGSGAKKGGGQSGGQGDGQDKGRGDRGQNNGKANRKSILSLTSRK